MSDGTLILVTAEWNRSFRSIARSVAGHLEEGQFAGRCHFLEADQPLGSVVLETLAQRPDAPLSSAEEALIQDVSGRRPLALVAFDPTAFYAVALNEKLLDFLAGLGIDMTMPGRLVDPSPDLFEFRLAEEYMNRLNHLRYTSEGRIIDTSKIN